MKKDKDKNKIPSNNEEVKEEEVEEVEEVVEDINEENELEKLKKETTRKKKTS